MNQPATAREALILEAIGDVARLMREVEVLAPSLEETRQAMSQASQGLRDELAAFEGRIAAITQNAKTQTVRHLAVRADEAARQSIEQQSRAMADAARVAFGAELGATMQRLQSTLQPLLDRRQPRWQAWLTHAAAVAATASATWLLALYTGPR